MHGRSAVEAYASELTLEKFIDAATFAAAPDLPGPSREVRTVLLTGATGFLGRYLALQWLQRMGLVGGKVIALVRAKSDDEARRRLEATFDSADRSCSSTTGRWPPSTSRSSPATRAKRISVWTQPTWQRLADTVDLIVDAAALVNHVLPYSQLFGPNVVGTAELIRIAVTTRIKPFVYISTISVGDGVEPGRFAEDADIREMSPVRSIDDNPATATPTATATASGPARYCCGRPTICAVCRCRCSAAT